MQEIRRRDEVDSGRDHAPLRTADDAVTLDTSDMTPEQVVEAVIEMAKARGLN